MQILWLYLVTAITFFALDFLGLRYIVKPVFERDAAPLLADSIRIGPAAAFYAAYVAGLIYLVSLPALREGSAGMALLNGAILGALAYGTYEFTNLATLKHWTWAMLATDLAWGTVLTGVSAWVGVTVMRTMG